MGVLLGALSAVLYGVADFLGGEGAKRAPAAAIVLWSGIVSFPFVVVVALMVGGTAGSGDLIIGALAGVSGAFGLVFLFAGLARGRAASVAPVSAVLAGAFPVLVAVALGERPSALAWVGVLLALPAVALSAAVGSSGSPSPSPRWPQSPWADPEVRVLVQLRVRDARSNAASRSRGDSALAVYREVPVARSSRAPSASAP